MPNQESSPFIGKAEVLETIVEERIEVPCSRLILGELAELMRPYPQEKKSRCVAC
jgi:hypothetical protein